MPRVKVTFHIDANGTMTMHAKTKGIPKKTKSMRDKTKEFLKTMKEFYRSILSQVDIPGILQLIKQL